MNRVEIREVLMQSKNFRTAYEELLMKVEQTDEYQCVQMLEYFPDFIPVKEKPEIKVSYGDMFVFELNDCSVILSLEHEKLNVDIIRSKPIRVDYTSEYYGS